MKSSTVGSLKLRERADARRRKSPRAAVVYEAIRLDGCDELERSSAELAWSGLVAGLSLGFSFLAQGLIQSALPDTDWRILVVKLAYGLGFVIVVIGRQQLFTENTVTPVLPLLKERTRKMALNLIRVSAIVLATNLAGTLIFAASLSIPGVFKPEVMSSLTELGRTAFEGDFFVTVVRAIYAGWLVALMVWLSPYAETARPAIVFILAYIIGIGHLDHVIAGSVDVLFLVATGQLAGWSYVTNFFVPTLIGNVLGGVVFVSLLNHWQVSNPILNETKTTGDLHRSERDYSQESRRDRPGV